MIFGRGIVAGMFIALAGVASSVACTGNADIGIAKIIAGLIFSAGLICTYMAGAYLFTGKLAVDFYEILKSPKLGKIKNYLIDIPRVYLFNFLGALLIALMAVTLPLEVQETIKHISEAKMNCSLPIMFVKGVLCNILVAFAVIFAKNLSNSVSQLIVTMTIPVSLFVICGFEHSIADMFFIPAAVLLGSSISFGQFIVALAVITVGNFIGGLLVACYTYEVRGH